MTVWVVRGGRYGEREAEALDNGVLTIGFGLLGDFSGVSGQDGFTEVLRGLHPDAPQSKVSNHAGQVRSFVERIQTGDLAVMPRKGTGLLAVGTVSSEYLHRPEAGEFAHGRQVRWLNTELLRDLLEEDLKRSLSADSTVFRPRATGAEERLRSLAEGRTAPPPPSGESEAPGPVPGEDEPSVNIGEYALDQIRAYVERNFHGHELSRLVGAVLEAQGFQVSVSLPGPDGGVDILAGKGPMGFDSPRICVQVKSGRQVSGVKVFRELQAVTQTFKADHGLLVSWGGFGRPAEQEARAMHFNIRLWSSDQLLEAVFDNYEQLPAGIRAELPLKRLWVLVQEEGG